ncbi:MAG: hypothetical protein F6K19_01455 [Cyanothece sp. SIO1E1]|nr:hypothetical protein [Cyanothece sp. SIO1E1]
MYIAIDFDGTCVAHEFPKVGKDIGAVPVLKELVDAGHKLILFTMRSDIENPSSKDYQIEEKGGQYLTEAINWFKENDIPLYGIQTNPTQSSWTKSPKAYAQIYIDDAALGCPLIYSKERPYVDWGKVSDHLAARGIFKSVEGENLKSDQTQS